MLSSKDYTSLGEELRHTDGCSHVMLDFTLVMLSDITLVGDGSSGTILAVHIQSKKVQFMRMIFIVYSGLNKVFSKDFFWTMHAYLMRYNHRY